MKFVNLAILFFFLSLTALAQNKDEPVIYLNLDTIPFNEVAIGNWYHLPYIVSAENLEEDILLSVPNVAGQGFRIREQGVTSWSFSIILNQSNGIIPETTIEVLCAPINEVFYSTIVTHTSGTLTVDLPVSGTGIGMGEPYIIIHPYEINFGNVAVGAGSLVSFWYDIQNDGSSTGTIIQYPWEQGFTDEDGYGFTSTTEYSGIRYVLFSPDDAGYFEGSVSLESTNGGVTGYLQVSGYGVIPAISLNAENHDFGNVEIGNYSSEFNYVVTGSTLVGNITITSPYGFEISLTSGTGFTDEIILQAIEGNVEDTQIFVRFAPQITTPYSGNIIHETDYGTTETITLNGVGVVGTSINNISENNFIIYPNPSNGVLNLTGLEITDITGKTIYTRAHKGTRPLVLQIDLSNHPKGIYFITIKTNKSIYTEKLIIQ